LDTPHVQLIVGRNSVPPTLQSALNRLNARVSIRSLGKALDSGVSPLADVCVILPDSQQPQDVLDRILNDATDRACATIVINPPSARDGFESFGTKAVNRATPHIIDENESASLSADELIGRIKALCEIRRPFRKMQDELHRLRERDVELTNGAQYMNEQLQLAGQVQTDLLPEPAVDCEPLEVSTLFLPAEHISGDIYDISRLDEDRFSFSIADATGHGLPAALLTILIKNSLQGKEIHNGSYHIIEPDVLLNRLNEELMRTNLTQCQFITALHAVFDRQTKNIRWARGGNPYPILIRPGELPRQIRSSGGLIGAFEQNGFEVVSHHFEPGDILLFFTDGLEALLLGKKTSYGDGSIMDTSWLKQLAVDGAESALATIRELALKQSQQDWHKDDVTAMVLKMS